MLAFANLPQIGRAITSIELFKNPGEITIFDSLTLIANRYNSLFTDTFLLTFINKYAHEVRAYQPMHEGKSLAHHLDPLALLARQLEI